MSEGNKDIYSLLNLVLLLVVVVGWPRDIILARMLLAADCRCQNQQISGRGAQAMSLRINGNKGQWGHGVYPGPGPLKGGKTRRPA